MSVPSLSKQIKDVLFHCRLVFINGGCVLRKRIVFVKTTYIDSDLLFLVFCDDSLTR